MPETIKFSRLIIKVFSSLALLTAAASLFIMLYSEAVTESGSALKQLSGVDFIVSRGLVIFIVALALSALGFLTSTGLGEQKKWSWATGLFFGLALLPVIPLGTVFGLKMIFCLAGQEARDWFKMSKTRPAGKSRTEIRLPEDQDLNQPIQ
ncbi:MAG: hypothetical protein ACPLRX_09780 [Candidatus Saccharicenans sp.]